MGIWREEGREGERVKARMMNRSVWWRWWEWDDVYMCVCVRVCGEGGREGRRGGRGDWVGKDGRMEGWKEGRIRRIGGNGMMRDDGWLDEEKNVFFVVVHRKKKKHCNSCPTKLWINVVLFLGDESYTMKRGLRMRGEQSRGQRRSKKNKRLRDHKEDEEQRRRKERKAKEREGKGRKQDRMEKRRKQETIRASTKITGTRFAMLCFAYWRQN